MVSKAEAHTPPTQVRGVVLCQKEDFDRVPPLRTAHSFQIYHRIKNLLFKWF